jgi:RND family efflux transporter MFP subunit
MQPETTDPRPPFVPSRSPGTSEINPVVQGSKHLSADTPARRAGFPIGPVVAAALVLGLGGWVAMRVKTELANQSSVAAKRDEVAKAVVETAAKPMAVSTTRGVAESWQPRVPLEGSLTPVREADLGFKASGRIGAIRVKVGDKVKTGALLASLESSEAAAQLVAAEAQVRAAEAQHALASDANKRTSAMVLAGGMAEASGVQAMNQSALAAAQMDAARAQVALARVNLRNHALTAPFAGTITRVPAGPGAVVAPGAPQFHVSDLSTLKLVGTVGEGAAALIAVGEELEIQGDGATATGKVSSVLASVDAATRRVPVEAEVVNGVNHTNSGTTSALRAGSFVRAQIHGGSSIPVLRYPHGVVRPGSQDEVMVVDNGVLQARRVLFITAPDGSILVRSGVKLDASEALLVSPSAEAKNGDRVVVTGTP